VAARRPPHAGSGPTTGTTPHDTAAPAPRRGKTPLAGGPRRKREVGFCRRRRRRR